MIITLFSHLQLNASDINVYTDTLSAGWNYMDSCVNFEINIDSTCRVSWTVTKIKKEYNNENGMLSLTSHPYDYRLFTDCPYSFHSVKSQNDQILDSIFTRWSPTRFKSLSYSSFRHGDDYSWNIPIAVASAKSSKYKNYRKNYPNTKYSANGLFVEFANETNAYKEMADLFREHNIDLKLVSVEKVFAEKVKNLKFAKELTKLGLKSEERVLWDIGMSAFELKIMTKEKE